MQDWVTNDKSGNELKLTLRLSQPLVKTSSAEPWDPVRWEHWPWSHRAALPAANLRSTRQDPSVEGLTHGLQSTSRPPGVDGVTVHCDTGKNCRRVMSVIVGTVAIEKCPHADTLRNWFTTGGGPQARQSAAGCTEESKWHKQLGD